MDHPLTALTNARIKAADEEGEFDNLSGVGKPLPQIKDPEGVVFNRILRNARVMPECVHWRVSAHLRAELQETSDRSPRRDIVTEMSMMQRCIDLAAQTSQIKRTGKIKNA